jgi:aminomuconate-semialdehyde/2-hydroxymuconate-6-semialdehyde dehydrogenase
MKTISNYINGEQLAPIKGQYLDNFRPDTGVVYSKVPNSTKEDLDQAVKAATSASASWAKTPVSERIRIIRKIASLIEEKSDQLAEIESIDNGKPLSLAKSLDLPRSSVNFNFYCDCMTQFIGESFPMENMAINYTTYSPLGVVGVISPWNLPLYLLTWKIAPALVTGNTVIAKPSEVTPMTAYELGVICQEAGLPPGVLNLVHGDGAIIGQHLVEHPDVQAISFTGSTQTGAQISKSAASSFKKVSLEMGGKNPNIIFDDANFDKAVETSVRSSFSNQGQICLCGSRMFIQKSIYEKFKKAFIEKAKELTVGPPLQDGSQVGALVSLPHMEKVLSYIQIAKDEGGKILLGGEKANHLQDEYKNGYYIQPTIIEGPSSTCRTNQEEIFGPVVSLNSFETEEEVIAMANSTKYGLSGSIWTQDISRAMRVSQAVDSGVLWVNTWMMRDLRAPFGGVKNSGLGREGGLWALKFFTKVKNICISH